MFRQKFSCQRHTILTNPKNSFPRHSRPGFLNSSSCSTPNPTVDYPAIATPYQLSVFSHYNNLQLPLLTPPSPLLNPHRRLSLAPHHRLSLTPHHSLSLPPRRLSPFLFAVASPSLPAVASGGCTSASAGWCTTARFVRPRRLSSLAPNALAPCALAPNALAPNALAPNALAPYALAPNALAPSALAPCVLAPCALAPCALAPSLCTLAPCALEPCALAPNALARNALAPSALAPNALAPNALAPNTLAPCTLAPCALAPNALAPCTLAPCALAPNALATCVDLVQKNVCYHFCSLSFLLQVMHSVGDDNRRDCPVKTANWRPSSSDNNRRTHVATCDNNDREFVFVASGTTVGGVDAWVLDTGATQHMTASATLLNNVTTVAHGGRQR
ncbi:unnamed protein product [Closterium sp. NIES-65]|nr:unnamed protein product [Closterium sp. NIES-65]